MAADDLPFEGNLLQMTAEAVVRKLALEVLPDSRARFAKNIIWRHGAPWVPVFCASCGVPYGYVPENLCTFACWLCNDCSDKYGAIAATMLMPDEKMWEKVRLEMLEEHGRFLTNEELLKLRDEGTTPLGKLLSEVK